MPLRKGSSRKTISANIKTLVHEYEEEGHIGSSHPTSRAKAVKQAVAIALDTAGVSQTKKAAPAAPQRTTARRER
jgi:hypothetical protein